MQWHFHKSRWSLGLFISTEVSNLEAVRSSTLSKLHGKQCKNGVLPLTHNCMCDLLERGHFRENKSSRYWKGPAGCSPANPISRLISIPPLEHFNAVSLSACLFRKLGAVTWEGEKERARKEKEWWSTSRWLYFRSQQVTLQTKERQVDSRVLRDTHWKWKSGINIHSHPVFTKQLLVWTAVSLLVHVMIFKCHY